MAGDGKRVAVAAGCYFRRVRWLTVATLALCMVWLHGRSGGWGGVRAREEAVSLAPEQRGGASLDSPLEGAPADEDLDEDLAAAESGSAPLSQAAELADGDAAEQQPELLQEQQEQQLLQEQQEQQLLQEQQQQGPGQEQQALSLPAVCRVRPHLVQPALRGPVLLASFPGSGNTWLRHVLQSGSRTLVGSMYRDESLRGAFPAESVRDGTAPFVKTHFPCEACWSNPRTGALIPVAKTGHLASASGTLYVLRSPLDALVAEFSRKATARNHTGAASPEQFGAAWDAFLRAAVPAWVRNARFYLARHVQGRRWQDAQGRPVVLTLYERFVRDFDAEAAVLFGGARYLLLRAGAAHVVSQLPSTPDALRCLARDSAGSFKRSRIGRFNPFSASQLADLCAQVAHFWQPAEWGDCAAGQLHWERLHDAIVAI